MSAGVPRTRAQLVRRLLAAPDRPAAERVARAASSLCDDETARAIEAQFRTLVRTDLHAARSAADAAGVVARLARTPLSRAIAALLVGLSAHVGGRHAVAVRELERAAPLFEEAGELAWAGDTCRMLILAAAELGQDDQARAAARRARALYRRAGGAEARQLAGIAMNVAYLHHQRDRLPQALQEYERARSAYGEAGDARHLAAVDYNKANILASLDRTDEARCLYRSARDAFAGEGLQALVLQADYALADLDALEGELDSALARLRSLRARHEELGDVPGAAHADLDASRACLRLNRLDEAVALARRARAHFSRAGNATDVARCDGVVASAALQEGRFREAARRFNAARDVQLGVGNRVAAARLATGLARAQVGLGDPRAARRLAQSAARSLERQGLARAAARARVAAAQAAWAAGDATTARRWARDVARGPIASREPAAELSARLLLARLDESVGRRGEAYRQLLAAAACIELMRPGVTTEESQLTFALDKTEVFEALVANRLAEGTPEAAREALGHAERGKARALAERLARGRLPAIDAGSPTARAARRRLQELDRALSLAEARLEKGEGPSGLRRRWSSTLRAALTERAAVLAALSREDRAVAALVGGAPDPWAGARALGTDEAALEYVEADGWLHAFVVRRDAVVAVPWIARTDEVRDEADLLRFQLGKVTLGSTQPAAHEAFVDAALRRHLRRLHDLLLEPVESALPRGGVRIIPHGLLHGLPFHAFESDEGAFIERHVVSHAPSLAVLGLLAQRSSPSGRGGLVLGVPDRAAPAIEQEVEAVSGLLGHADVLRGADATREALSRAGDGWGVLHVACHGVYGEGDPGVCGLRLGDAWLSLPEVYGLDSVAELVVLSGCETGRGTVHSGDEWVGLVRAFLQVGARAVVASLWDVHDESAVGLMTDFYANLVRGVSVAEALALAQRRAIGRGAGPARWAPFLAVGDAQFALRVERAA